MRTYILVNIALINSALFGALIYTCVNSTDSDVTVHRIARPHNITHAVDMDVLFACIAYVESRYNAYAIGTSNDRGIVQITPIYVREVNRILGYRKYSHSDAFCPKKSRDMFDIIQGHYNPSGNIEKAIHLHNRSDAYFNKVLTAYKELTK